MSKRCITKIAAIAGLTLVLLLGCGGLNQQPIAPDRAAAPQAQASSKAMPRLAKWLYTDTGRGWFYPNREGSLTVSFPPYGDATTVRVEQATFTASQGAIAEATRITMKVYTSTLLSEVLFDFSPDGLTFNPQATLTVILSGPVKADLLKAYHISNWTVSEVPLTVTPLGGNRWQVTLQVPGFSIYVMGDDWTPEAGW
ncbi:MAG: hypothetical protein A3F84_00785 [Candidatus Handelsmanbacteria bacterium RIFCSPLOWO2_12_FULL_64_10]|uniref:Uncharacterized protein n=1 Tax=Handelsmanbacteria sp. (strain RIFCSPLOWO2_12_FULL_64_10) TaxID=1817868 RepID=A0A1F6CRV6_HANXR|nr:MAG: hypothetical protein A3F84_00785 [Candidatus Handelsmanbacteria bacterium RIFCSPLOWO2_12_FULL_64_10]